MSVSWQPCPFTHLLRQKRQYLSDNGVETLRDLRLKQTNKSLYICRLNKSRLSHKIMTHTTRWSIILRICLTFLMDTFSRWVYEWWVDLWILNRLNWEARVTSDHFVMRNTNPHVLVVGVDCVTRFETTTFRKGGKSDTHSTPS